MLIILEGKKIELFFGLNFDQVNMAISEGYFEAINVYCEAEEMMAGADVNWVVEGRVRRPRLEDLATEVVDSIQECISSEGTLRLEQWHHLSFLRLDFADFDDQQKLTYTELKIAALLWTLGEWCMMRDDGLL